MEKKHVLGVFALAVVALLGVSMVSAFGFGKGFMTGTELTEEERNLLTEEQEAIRNSIQEGDYETWKSLMEERVEKMRESLTEENFNAIKERHAQREEFRNSMQEARESGDRQTMEELREEFGQGKKIHMRNKNLSGCVFSE